jgi:uncharacterized protein YjaG (DUF416 family)
MINNFQTTIKQKVLNLNRDKLSLFCNLNCEKMLPCYKIFFETEQWGDFSFFDNLVKSLYISIIEKSALDYNQLEKELTENFPDLDEFESEAASYGFDTSIAFDEMISFLLSDNTEHAVNNSLACINTVDMFVQLKESPEGKTAYKDIPALEALIFKDEYMQRELKRQLDILTELENTITIDEQSIKKLRTINESLGPLVDIKLIK